jgi:hypothetical protein
LTLGTGATTKTNSFRTIHIPSLPTPSRPRLMSMPMRLYCVMDGSCTGLLVTAPSSGTRCRGAVHPNSLAAACTVRSLRVGTHQANCTISQPTFGIGRDRPPISPVTRAAIRCSEGSEGLGCRDPESASQRTRFYSGTAGVDELGSSRIASLRG